MKRYLFLTTISLLTIINNSMASDIPTDFSPKLFLAGGSLKTCSSMAIKNCHDQKKSGKKGLQYSINKHQIEKFAQHWPAYFTTSHKSALLNLLYRANNKSTNAQMSKDKLLQLLTAYDKSLIQKLPDREYFYLLDSLEVPVLKQGQPVSEIVYLNNSRNPFAVDLYHQFVRYAAKISNKPRPVILIMTASARDPFEAVDFYTQVFTQAGADPLWLPIDASLQRAMSQGCEHLEHYRLKIQGNAFRSNIYPKLTEYQQNMCQNPAALSKLITNADGLFINGGDQSKTVQSLKTDTGEDTVLMAKIRKKFVQGKIIIGGTSAGTAVQTTAAMITNGRSEIALVRGAKTDVLPAEGCDKNASCPPSIYQDELTYRSSGGLGLFQLGLLDTHFSERGRQGRLAQLLVDTSAQLAFGVDETTALVISHSPPTSQQQYQLTVVGQGGVFILEKQNKYKGQKASNRQLLSHYITYGDHGYVSNNHLRLKFSEQKVNITSEHQQKLPMQNQYDQVFDGKKYQQLAELLCRTTNQQIHLTSRWQQYSTQITLEKTQDARSAIGAIKINNPQINHEQPTTFCSYQNYLLTIH